MEWVVLRTLVEWGYTAERREIRPEELFSADEVIMTNSLIGAVSVLSLDGKRLGRPSDLCDRINGSV